MSFFTRFSQSLSRNFSEIMTVVACVVFVGLAVVQFLDPCLFEADEAGCREYVRQKPSYEKVRLHASAFFVSSRRWRSKGLEWLSQDGAAVRLGQTPPTDALASAPQITVFIHGFRGINTVIASYFEELVSFLATNDRYTGAIVVLDWPSTARAWTSISEYERKQFRKLIDGPRGPGRGNEGSGSAVPVNVNAHDEMYYWFLWEDAAYKADKSVASAVGAASLAALIERLWSINPQARIHIVAHSMGCYVVQQALKKQSSIAEKIKHIIWLAPDVAYDVFEDGPFRMALSRIENLSVFYSRNDGALKWPSRLANGGLMLGAYGPKNLQDVPATVVMHDLTAVLATDVPASSMKGTLGSVLGDVQVHTIFLRAISPVPVMVAQILREPKAAVDLENPPR